MRTTLHVFKDDAHIAAFDLSPGAHLLGIGLDADLVLGDDRVSNDVCYVDVDHQGQVIVRALPTVDLQLASGEVVAKAVLIVQMMSV